MIQIKANPVYRLKYSIPYYQWFDDRYDIDVDIDVFDPTQYVMYTYYNFTVKTVICLFVNIQYVASEKFQKFSKLSVELIPDTFSHMEDFMSHPDGEIFYDMFEAYDHIIQMLQVFDKAIIMTHQEYNSKELVRVNLKDNRDPIRNNLLLTYTSRGAIMKNKAPFMHRRYLPYEIHICHKFDRKQDISNYACAFTDKYDELPTIKIHMNLFKGDAQSEFYCVPYENSHKEKDYVLVWYPKSYCYNNHGGVEIFPRIKLNGSDWVVRYGSPFPKKVKTIKTPLQWEGRYRYILENTNVTELKNVIISPCGYFMGKIDYLDLMHLCISDRMHREIKKNSEDK